MGKHLKFFVWTAIFMLVLSFSVGSFATAGEEDNKADTETVTETFTFETTENDSGYTLADTDLSDIFTVDAVAGGTADISDDGNAKLAMFSQVYLPMEQAYDMLQRSYTFQIDFGSTGAPESAIYLRAIDPQTYTKMNPIQSVAQTFNFYEWDWYAETGGSGTSETGGSGIKVYQRKNKIFVDLKLYVEDGLNIRGKAIDFDFPEGFKQDDLNTYRFVDDGVSKVDIYVNDVMLCTVEYGGDPGTYPDGDDEDSEVLYYKNAVIKGADGTELLSVDNARICAEYSTIAIANRGDKNEAYFNNIVLTYVTDKLPEQETPVPTDKPDPSPSAAKSTPSASTPQVNEGSDGVNMTYVLIAVICAAIAVCAIIVIVISLKKKK